MQIHFPCIIRSQTQSPSMSLTLFTSRITLYLVQQSHTNSLLGGPLVLKVSKKKSFMRFFYILLNLETSISTLDYLVEITV